MVSPNVPHKKVLLHKLTVFLVILETSLVTLGQLFIVIGGFLAQMLKVKCISNVFGDTFLMLSRNIFYQHDASVGGHNSDIF